MKSSEVNQGGSAVLETEAPQESSPSTGFDTPDTGFGSSNDDYLKSEVNIFEGPSGYPPPPDFTAPGLPKFPEEVSAVSETDLTLQSPRKRTLDSGPTSQIETTTPATPGNFEPGKTYEFSSTAGDFVEKPTDKANTGGATPGNFESGKTYEFSSTAGDFVEKPADKANTGPATPGNFEPGKTYEFSSTAGDFVEKPTDKANTGGATPGNFESSRPTTAQFDPSELESSLGETDTSAETVNSPIVPNPNLAETVVDTKALKSSLPETVVDVEPVISKVETKKGKTPEVSAPRVEKLKSRKETLVIPGAPKGLDLTPPNKSLWSRMTEGAKNFAKFAYDTVYKVPGLNRIVAKMEIAYLQNGLFGEYGKKLGFGGITAIDNKLATQKQALNGVENDIQNLDQSEASIKDSLVALRQQGVPIPGEMSLELSIIARKREELLTKKERFGTKIDGLEGRRKMFEEKRDKIAEQVIGAYAEKMRPLQEELTYLDERKNEVELLGLGLEVNQREELARIDGIDKAKHDLSGALLRAGWTQKQVDKHRDIVKITKQLNADREKIRKEKEDFNAQKSGIERQIAGVNAKAAPYKNIVNEFQRVKERKNLSDLEGEINARVAESGETDEEGEGGDETETESSAPESSALEASEAEEKPRDTESYVKAWNEHIKGKIGSRNFPEKLDIRDFSEKTRMSKTAQLNFEDFQKILTQYYKVKKVPMNGLGEEIKSFYDKSIKVIK